jgi:ABC-type anion transport system duplicated permease subunit
VLVHLHTHVLVRLRARVLVRVLVRLRACVRAGLVERARERERETERKLCGIHMPMHIEELIVCVIFLCMKIFFCFIKQACFFAIVSKWGGVDDSILRLSFALLNNKGRKIEI